MKRLISFAAAFVLCLTLSSQASAQVEKIQDINEIIPVALATVNPCNGALVFLEGTDHQIFKLWSNGHFKQHFQYNLSGEDTDGVKYKMRDAWNYNGDFFTGFPFQYTISWSLISQGAAPNFVQHVRYKMDADGNIVIDEYWAECRGG